MRSRQVVLWLGFGPTTLMLLGRSANHYSTVLSAYQVDQAKCCGFHIKKI